MYTIYKDKEEEEEDMEIDREEFEDFIAWLIMDGLKPRKSARLWKKTIYASLKNNQEMTIENYNDFLEDREKNQNIILENMIDKMDSFEYSELIDKKIRTDRGIKHITSYQIADSMIHLFFSCGKDLLVSRKEIQRIFGKNNEI